MSKWEVVFEDYLGPGGDITNQGPDFTIRISDPDYAYCMFHNGERIAIKDRTVFCDDYDRVWLRDSDTDSIFDPCDILRNELITRGYENTGNEDAWDGRYYAEWIMNPEDFE